MRKKWLLAILSACIYPAVAPASPILNYNFNETGTTATSTGTDPAVVTMENASGTATDLHSAAGTGVSGDLVGSALYGIDRALDVNSTVGIAINNTATSLYGLETHSWTVSGWYKTASPISGGGKSIFNGTLGNNFNTGFFTRISNTAGNMRVNRTGDESAGVWQDSNKWVFFAVSYDSALSANNVNFYRGYRNAAEAGSNPASVSLVDSLTLATTQTATASPGFSIGNIFFSSAVSGVQNFPGLLDDIRVDGSITGSGGADSLATLEGYRSQDVAVPEPAMAGVLLVGGALLALRRRRNAWL